MDKDFEIIEMKNKWDNQNNSDIYSEVYIDGEVFRFEETELFGGEISVMLPIKFIDMPLKMKKFKYPAESRPKIIKTDLQGKININFNVLDIPVTDALVQKCMLQMKKITQNLMPNIVFENDYVGKTQNGSYFGYEYISNAVDGKMYNFVYGVCMNGKLMNGACNCPTREREWWQKTFIQVCESIRVEEKNGERV